MISAVPWQTLPLVVFALTLTPMAGVAKPAAAFESNGATKTVLETKLAPWREPCEDTCVQIPQAKGAAEFLPDDSGTQRVEIGAMIELPIPTSMVGIFDTKTAQAAAVTLQLARATATKHFEVYATCSLALHTVVGKEPVVSKAKYGLKAPADLRNGAAVSEENQLGRCDVPVAKNAGGPAPVRLQAGDRVFVAINGASILSGMLTSRQGE